MKTFGVVFGNVDPEDKGYHYEDIDAHSEDEARCIVLNLFGPYTQSVLLNWWTNEKTIITRSPGN